MLCPTCAGHEIGEDSVQIYREALHPNGKVIYISKHSKHGSPGPLHGKPISAPYGPLEGMQQKRLAARQTQDHIRVRLPDRLWQCAAGDLDHPRHCWGALLRAQG